MRKERKGKTGYSVELLDDRRRLSIGGPASHRTVRFGHLKLRTTIGRTIIGAIGLRGMTVFHIVGVSRGYLRLGCVRLRGLYTVGRLLA